MLTIALVHFASATLGLFAYATMAGMMGWIEPYWSDGKGLFVFIIGIPLLALETLLFLGARAYLRRQPGETRSLVSSGAAALVGGTLLVPLFSIGGAIVVHVLPTPNATHLFVALAFAAVMCTIVTVMVTH